MSEANLPLPNLPLSNDTADSRSGALLPVNMAERANGDWNGAPVPVFSAEQRIKADVTIYLHALRRHWLLSLGIGLLCAGIIGPAIWFLVGTQYRAYSTLRVSMQEDKMMSRDGPGLIGPGTGVIDRDRFEIYKNTQESLLESRLVLVRALRKPEVARLPAVQDETRKGDPVVWLGKRLSVSFPGKAEVMMVSVNRDDPHEAKILTDAIVDAYLNQVVNVEADKKRSRLSELDTICDAKQQEIREKREKLKGMVTDAGSSEAEMLNVQQKLVLERLALYRTQSASASFEIGKYRGELVGQQALLANVDKSDVPQADIDQMMQADPEARQLQTEMSIKKMEETYEKNAIRPGAINPHVGRAREEASNLRQQFELKMKEMQVKARQKRKSLIETEITRLTAQLKSMEVQQETVKAEMEKMQKDAEKFGKVSVEVEMLRSELKNLDAVLSDFKSEREKLKVELNATARIVQLEAAEDPLVPSNTLPRIAMMVLGMMAGLCCPALIVVLWDTRAGRINTANDVSHGLRLPVIGSMPLIPAKVIRQLGSPSPRYRAWHLRLTESVDGIAARLLHKAGMEQCRVIMVSSATGGEGKTTLATQLALSLARTGRRTVLVDFDLRRPAFDEVFGVPLSPGISETLRHEANIADLPHPSGTDNLDVVTAGRWDRQALAALSNGSASPMFKHLRDTFDFVVIDTSPILPVADARFVSQFVDSVVLSVFRDVSQAPKIQAACDILAAFGVQSVEAVVTGHGNSDLYGRHTGYESTVSAS